MSSSASDDAAAARWAVRLDGGPLGDAERSELDAWLEADARRQGALLRAEATLAYLDRGRALAEPVEPVAYRPAFGRRAFVAGGSLGAFAAIGLLGFVLSRPRTLEIATAVGEVRRVTLADGSVAAMNTDSRLAVLLLDRRRQVRLEGEAWFEVASDRTRPFVVEAGDVRVQATGTAFAVRRREEGADVLVTEGSVEAWTVGRPAARTRIAAGSKGFVADAASRIEVVQASSDIDRALAWRKGELALSGESLDYAVAELNRYNRRKIVIADRKLGREPLVGYFRTDRPENFGRAVADMFGARMAIEGDTIRLSR